MHDFAIIQDIKNIRNSIQYLSVNEEFDVPKFFYNHLREDLQVLGQFLSINNDDVILLMHLIAKTILYRPPYILDCCNELLTEDDRRAWEERFNMGYILPVIQVTQEHVCNNYKTCITYVYRMPQAK